MDQELADPDRGPVDLAEDLDQDLAAGLADPDLALDLEGPDLDLAQRSGSMVIHWATAPITTTAIVIWFAAV